MTTLNDAQRGEGLRPGMAAPRQEHGKPEPASTAGSKLSDRRAGALSSWLRRADELAIENTRKITGADISSHSPDDLTIVDSFLDADFKVDAEQRREKHSASIVYGSYLGEVFVRNLGGEWHYPSWIQAVRILISRNRRMGERYCYIVLTKERVGVFEAAFEAIDKTSARYSLYDFYRKYAQRWESRPRETSGEGK